MSRYAMHVDGFTALDDLKPTERRDPEAVLDVLRRAQRFSVWDMDTRAIRDTVCDLLERGIVRQRKEGEPGYLGYPWCAVEIVDR